MSRSSSARSRLEKMADYVDTLEQPMSVEDRLKSRQLKESDEKWQRIRTKVEAVAIVALAIFVLYYTNFYYEVTHNQKIRKAPLNFAFLFSAIGIGLCSYMIIYLGYIKKSMDWEKEKPREILFATVSFLAAFVCFMISFWPVWHIWTPIILLILMMGLFIVVIHIPL
eukprot:TRINITY_DN5005_c0_g2_i1.p2 TRINITY_DN5005_c0_g2~~TRINITY_DN5005_c0_g2_i1.p2  ORF type:complete len:168 (+),score=45.76 TRINITY_DN5005_c0_g2_i1:62-565(+)